MRRDALVSDALWEAVGPWLPPERRCGGRPRILARAHPPDAPVARRTAPSSSSREKAHPITPAPLTAGAHEVLAAAPPGEALPDGAFWLVPTAAPPSLAPAARAVPATPTPTPPAPLAPFFASQTRVPGISAFFAFQTAVAPRRRQVTRAAPGATRSPGGWPAGQS